jgi:fumarate reductase subunit D
MTTRARHHSARYADEHASHRTASSPAVRLLARVGFVARGLVYAVIGAIALLIAFGKTRGQADGTGALHALSGTPVGKLALWLLIVGFFGMALWRLAQVMYDGGTEGAANRPDIGALFRVVLYAVLGWGVLEFALGIGSPRSTNQQSVDLTAGLLRRPGGQMAAILIGLVLIAAGLYLAYKAWRLKFLADLETAEMSPATRRIVARLGQAGGIARGIVFATVGAFLTIAASRAQPSEAKGVDSALRALAATPLGPLLLVLIAAGLILFALFSFSESRWRKL